MAKFDYAAKLETYAGRTLFESLELGAREAARTAALTHRLTFQEFREVAECARDLWLWDEAGFDEWWSEVGCRVKSKAGFMRALRAHMARLRRTPRDYDAKQAHQPGHESKPIVREASGKRIWGMCPVASERTVCCNLRTIDAVENCVFGCSYCSVQTFYTDRIVFHEDFAEKLERIQIDPGRFCHFGTGQASDALAWGNKHGILDALCGFAATRPNVLLELKTKSDNVRHFLDHDVPFNVVCSWSLNPQTIIDHEEHFTANLERRLAAARAVADRGLGVAFHFHPMVHCQNWEREYAGLASELMQRFSADEVAFVSFGSVTLIRPVLRKVRELGNATRIHQMEFVPDPHGKLTCTDDVKVRMFAAMREWFEPWRDRVFFYLCMEAACIWERSFGYAYDTNEEFEADLGRNVMAKLQSLSNPSQRTTDGTPSR
jgi:spore photoproduct lyase